MEGFTRITKLVVELYQRAYGPTSVEGASTTYTIPPGEGLPAVVKDQDAANRLQRLDDEILYLANSYGG